MGSYSRRALLQTLAGAGVLGLVGPAPAAEPPPGRQLSTGGIRKLTELRYVASSAGGAQTLDLYLPAGAATKAAGPAGAGAALAPRPVPTLVYFHGGAWVSGDKDQYSLLGLSLATQGIAVAIPNYRLASDAKTRHPTQVHDAAAAVAWLRKHAPEYGLLPDRMVVGGHSAGAYLAAMLAFEPKFLGAVGDKPEALRGFIGMEGIYDLQLLASHFPSYKEDFLAAAFGEAEAAWRGASPQYQPLSLQRPWLIVDSLEDELVDLDQSKQFSVALSAKGVPVQYVVTPHGNHFGVVAQLSLPLSPVAGQVVRFVRAVTEPLAP